jgi:hypothetical protein
VTVRVRRVVLSSAAVLLVCWLAFLGFVGWAMRQPPAVFGRVMEHMPTPAYFLFPFETMWTAARKGNVQVGESAPEGVVQRLDTKQPVALRALWAERPVVLVFGSYT